MAPETGTALILTGGGLAAGYYGPRSFAAYGERARDLFLEQQWELDEGNWFARPAASGFGVWLSRESITSIELYAGEHDGEKDGE